MKKKTYQKSLDIAIVKAARRKSREEEIQAYGKQICFRTLVQKNKKKYDRNREKRTRYDSLGSLVIDIQY